MNSTELPDARLLLSIFQNSFLGNGDFLKFMVKKHLTRRVNLSNDTGGFDIRAKSNISYSGGESKFH